MMKIAGNRISSMGEAEVRVRVPAFSSVSDI
jgi:hypothetical protein